jgi:hypothetical protein
MHSKNVSTWIISSLTVWTTWKRPNVYLLGPLLLLQLVCEYRGVSAHHGCTCHLERCTQITSSHILCGVIVLYPISVFILIYARYTSCCKTGDIREHKKLLFLYVYYIYIFFFNIQYIEHFGWKACCEGWVAPKSVDKNSALWCDIIWMGK